MGNVTIKVVNTEWVELMKFPASKTGSISEDADKAGFEIPVACWAGACFFCVWRVKSWLEHIDIGKLGVPLVDIDADQVLMCIGWIKDQSFDGPEEHEVVIERDL